jgi:hypothetical protein
VNKDQLQQVLDAHGKWLRNEGGERADLQRADLQGADLQGADLRGADLDYACWPLWCGTSGVIVDDRIVYQLAAHLCSVTCDSPDYAAIRALLLPYASKSYRAIDLGIVGKEAHGEGGD